jgi:hypothetical protein
VFVFIVLAVIVTVVPDRVHEPGIGVALCTEAKPNGAEVKVVLIEKRQVVALSMAQEPANLPVAD